MEEILDELKYHRKLLEDILSRLDENRARADKAKVNAEAAMSVLMSNPILNANPKMAEIMKSAMRNAGIGGA